jgi:hypothetical protein
MDFIYVDSVLGQESGGASFLHGVTVVVTVVASSSSLWGKIMQEVTRAHVQQTDSGCTLNEVCTVG